MRRLLAVVNFPHSLSASGFGERESTRIKRITKTYRKVQSLLSRHRQAIPLHVLFAISKAQMFRI